MTQQIEVNSATLTPALMPALDAIARSMNEAEYRYNLNEASLTATFPIDMSYLEFRARATQRSLYISVRYSIRIPAELRPEMLKFMNAYNWKTIISNLEMDADGEIVCRLTVPLDAGLLTFSQADIALHTALGSASRCASPIFRMTFSGLTAAEALEALDGHNN